MKFPLFDNLLQKWREGPRLGIAFSGGGARGFSHIGVALALERFGLRASVCSGVSAGAIAAAMYGSGMSAQDMRECFHQHLRFADYKEWTVPRESLMSLRKFRQMLRRWLPVQQLEDMKNVLGHMAYVLEGMRKLSKVRSYTMKVTCGDRAIEGDFIFGMITNSLSVGGFKKITGDNVKLDDVRL